MNINPETAKEIPCKNVLIYGHCKYEDKGCVFSHPSSGKALSPTLENSVLSPTPRQAKITGNLHSSTTKSDNTLDAQSNSTASPTPAAKLATPTTIDSKRKFNMNTPSFQPSVQSMTSKFATLSPKLKEIPVFVPSGMDSSIAAPSPANPKQDSTTGALNTFSGRKFNTATPSFTPSTPFESTFAYSSSNLANAEGLTLHYGQINSSNNSLAFLSSSHPQQQVTQPPKQQNPYLNAGAAAVPTPGSNLPVNATDFMFQNQNTLSFPLNHHLYAPAPPPRLATSLKPHQTSANSMFIPNDLRETLTKKNEATLQTLPLLSLPDHVGIYHSLVPINASLDQLSNVYQLPSYVYKVISNYDGLPYALRRIDQGSRLRILNEGPLANVKKWRALEHPNVARLHDVFTSISLSTDGEPSLFLTYDYYPLANTLQEQHITRKLGGKLEPVTENLLWLYLVQLTGALIAIHEVGLHAGSSLSLSKVLVTNKNRVRLGAVGVDDILDYESIEFRKEQQDEEDVIEDLQLGDVTKLGRLITDLASTLLPPNSRGTSPSSLISHLQKSTAISLSDNLISAVSALLNARGGFDLNNYYATHLTRASIKLVNGLQNLTDFFEGQLVSEIENDRLFRLLAKMNVVLDRPENDGDITGSTSVLKLFRDYLFHPVDQYGKPSIDLSRILTNLNKLDVGVDEKLLLLSREEDSCIIVSYKEIKDSLDLNFRALIR